MYFYVDECLNTCYKSFSFKLKPKAKQALYVWMEMLARPALHLFHSPPS